MFMIWSVIEVSRTILANRPTDGQTHIRRAQNSTRPQVLTGGVVVKWSTISLALWRCLHGACCTGMMRSCDVRRRDDDVTRITTSSSSRKEEWRWRRHQCCQADIRSNLFYLSARAACPHFVNSASPCANPSHCNIILLVSYCLQTVDLISFGMCILFICLAVNLIRFDLSLYGSICTWRKRLGLWKCAIRWYHTSYVYALCDRASVCAETGAFS